MGRRIPCLVTSTAVATFLSLVAARAQDDFDRTPEDCVHASRIRSTQVLDDQNILFYMRGNRVYRNELPEACPRLASEGRFLYERRVGQSIGRLCRIDSITVLESVGAVPYGATCRLGKFYPITQPEVDEIVGMSRSAEQVDVDQVELPEESESEPAEDGDTAAADDSAGE